MSSYNILVSLPSLLVTLGLCSVIALTCYAGDQLLQHVSKTYPQNIYLRAVTDSCTHAAVGGISWAVVEGERLFVDFHSWINCLVCIFLSALVDVDHFLAAGSFDIQKAVNLSRRPPFHNTSLILVVVLACWILKRYFSVLSIFTLLFLCAWFSHHLRDANHRGLWFYPLGHTPVFPFTLYVCCIIALALSIRFVYLHAVIPKSQRSFGTDIYIV